MRNPLIPPAANAKCQALALHLLARMKLAWQIKERGAEACQPLRGLLEANSFQG
jgi:hypothetical protein